MGAGGDRYYDVEDCRYLLVYAMRKDGSTGFYLYDTVETAFLKYSDSLFNLSGSVGVTPVPDVTPVPNDTDLNDPESETELSLWGECKAYFGRLFGSEATAVDWLITVFLILFIVLLMVLAVFIVYAVKKRKEEAEDSVPLSVPGETRNFRKMVSLEEYEEEEPGESENTSDTEADEAVKDVIEEEPASYDIEEAEEEKTAEQPLDFTIADLEGESMDFEEAEEDRTPDTDEKPEEWPLDEKVFDDFIDKDDKKE